MNERDHDAVRLSLDLTPDEAYALAELCKRITWHHCRELSVDQAECQQQLSATVRVRQALQASGVFVR